jgi:hypothetical protein
MFPGTGKSFLLACAIFMARGVTLHLYQNGHEVGSKRSKLKANGSCSEIAGNVFQGTEDAMAVPEIWYKCVSMSYAETSQLSFTPPLRRLFNTRWL